MLQTKTSRAPTQQRSKLLSSALSFLLLAALCVSAMGNEAGMTFRYQSLATSTAAGGGVGSTRLRGLPQVSVEAIAQGADGFVWIGTQNGIARFDGLEFEIFNTQNTEALTSGWVEAMFADNTQRLWVVTTDAILIFEDNEFRVVSTDPEGTAIRRVTQTSDGLIWFGGDRLRVWDNGELRTVVTQARRIVDMRSLGSHLLMLDERNHVIARHNNLERPLDPALWREEKIHSLTHDAEHVYLTTSNHLFVLRHEGGEWYSEATAAPAGTELVLTAAGNGWVFGVTTGGAIFQFLEGEGGSSWETVEVPVEVPVSSNLMESLVLPGPQLFIGTRASGLHSYWASDISRPSAESPVTKARAWSFFSDEHIHLVSDNGIYRRVRSDEWELEISRVQLGGNVAYSYWHGPYGDFVGTRSGLYFRESPGDSFSHLEDLGSLQINVIKPEGEVLWLATMRGLYEYDHTTGRVIRREELGERAIRSFIRDSRGSLWIATQNGLLEWVDDGVRVPDADSLSTTFASAVIEFEPGWLAVTSFGEGLFVRNPEGEWRHFETDDGLPFQDLFSVIAHQDSLWVTAASGILRIDIPALKTGVARVETVLRDDGLFPSRDRLRCCNGAGDSRSVLLLDEEQLLVPTFNGPMSISLRENTSNVPRPLITSVINDGRRVPLTQTLVLGEGMRDIDIGFATPNLASENLPEYRYRMDPINDSWIYVGHRNVAYFTNIPSGPARFELQARVGGSDWLSAEPLNLYVTPYLYETWYARILLVLLLVVLFWMLLRYRTFQLSQKARLLEEAVEQRTAEVRAVNEEISELARDSRRIVRLANALIITITKSGEILDWNQTATRLTGLSKADVRGRNLVDVFPNASPPIVPEALFEGLNRFKTLDNLRFSFASKSGKRLTLVVGGSLLPSFRDQPERLVLVGQDLTQQLEREQQLIQASRIATLGEMATGMAHEINQPLNAIKLAVVNVGRLMTADVVDKPKVDAKLSRILEQITRASKLIEHLKLYGRRSDSPDSQSYSRFDLREAVQTALTLFKEQLAAEQIDLRSDIPPEPLWVHGDSLLTEQVIINVLSNARDAIRSNSLVEVADRYVAVSCWSKEDHVVLEVEDTGGGVSVSVMQDMFEPFFTTKDPDKGAGLGLSLAYSAVSSMSGEITVENTKVGLRLRVDLPLSQPV